MTAIQLVQPVGDQMAPALMTAVAIMAITIPAITVAVRWVTRMIRGWF